MGFETSTIWTDFKNSRCRNVFVWRFTYLYSTLTAKQSSKCAGLNLLLNFCIKSWTLLRDLISKLNSFRNSPPPWNSDTQTWSVHIIVVMNFKIWEPDKLKEWTDFVVEMALHLKILFICLFSCEVNKLVCCYFFFFWFGRWRT